MKQNKLTETEKLNKRNARAIQRQRQGIKESAELMQQVKDGKLTAAEALKLKCKGK